jgi:hypothetical protein
VEQVEHGEAPAPVVAVGQQHVHAQLARVVGAVERDVRGVDVPARHGHLDDLGSARGHDGREDQPERGGAGGREPAHRRA